MVGRAPSKGNREGCGGHQRGQAHSNGSQADQVVIGFCGWYGCHGVMRGCSFRLGIPTNLWCWLGYGLKMPRRPAFCVAPHPQEAANAVNLTEFITELYCRVDDAITGILNITDIGF